jgi:hypothetical protein
LVTNSLTEAEIEALVDQRPDLVERLKSGDADAFTEMLEVIGAKVESVTVRHLADG